jgi:DNA invertase Pin-like site-specific DNA recombinase
MSYNSTPRVAHSYLRFSCKRQATGDSYRRQTEARDDFCRRYGWTLSGKTYEDLGVSAWRGKNALVGNLGEFLKAIERGTVRPGEALICENIDRITRQGLDPGWDTIRDILRAGVFLITLSPERVFGIEATKRLSAGALEIMLILERAAEESEAKSRRLRAAWEAKKNLARANQPQRRTEHMGEGCHLTTRVLPSWVQEVDGRAVLVPGTEDTIRTVFAMRKSGMGWLRLVSELTRRGVPPLPGAEHWVRSTVVNLIRDGRVTGRYQPTKRDANDRRVPDGDAIEGYYPVVISCEEWQVVNATVGKRGQGHTSKHANLFRKGLIVDALGGGCFLPATRSDGGAHRRVLLPTASVEGRGTCRSLSLPVFEGAFLRLLREVTPADVLPHCTARNESQDIQDKLDLASASLQTLANLLRVVPSETLARQVADEEAHVKELLARLSAAQARNSDRLSATWDEVPHLLAALERAEDKTEARQRLRVAITAIVAEVRLLVVPRGVCRFAAIGVYFTGGRHRLYVAYHRPPHQTPQRRTEGWWDAWSYGSNDEPELDLRLPEHVAEMRQALEAAPLPQAPTPRA